MPLTTLSALNNPVDVPRARLMLVDDQPLVIQSMQQVFDGVYELVFATTAQRALKLCLQAPPDLILLDVVMPDMSGLELCREFKRHDQTSHIPVIFVTGGGSAQEEDACWEAGGVDFITKPVNASTLKHRVHAHLTSKRQADLLRRMVFIDGLTGVANRRYFDELMGKEWRRLQREKDYLAVAMIDVDHFKRYNDSYGHQAGDECLRRVAAAISDCLRRPHDLLARYGGEEFACVLPQTNKAGAVKICEEMAAAVRQLAIPHQASDVADVVTVSIGVAATTAGDVQDADELIRLADSALYVAKQNGRGRVQA